MKVNGRANVELASLKERKEKSRFLTVCMKTVILEGAAMCTGSISHVDNDSEAQKS